MLEGIGILRLNIEGSSVKGMVRMNSESPVLSRPRKKRSFDKDCVAFHGEQQQELKRKFYIIVFNEICMCKKEIQCFLRFLLLLKFVNN